MGQGSNKKEPTEYMCESERGGVRRRLVNVGKERSNKGHIKAVAEQRKKGGSEGYAASKQASWLVGILLANSIKDASMRVGM